MDLLLETGDALDIVLEGGWRRQATVTAVDAPHVDLAFTGAGAALPGGLSWCSAAIEWTTGAGTPASTRGIVHAVDDVLRLEVTGGTGIVQQREHPRVRASVEVQLTDGEHEFVARTVDLSEGGMLLGGAEALQPGQQVRFTLHLEGVTVNGTGTVVRATAAGERGVQFDEQQRVIGDRLVGARDADALSAA